MKKILCLMAAAFFLVAGSINHAFGQITALYFSGDPGYVAGGENETLSASDGFAMTAGRNGQGGDSFTVNNYSTAPFQQQVDYSVDFSSATGVQLSTGLYLDATRYPFNISYNPYSATNGLSFDGNGRGDNTLTGEFIVLDAEYDDLGTLTSFAADFIQNDEGNIYDQDYGSIRYNSTIPLDIYNGVPPSLPVPEPSAWMLGAVAAGALLFLTRLRAPAN